MNILEKEEYERLHDLKNKEIARLKRIISQRAERISNKMNGKYDESFRMHDCIKKIETVYEVLRKLEKLDYRDLKQLSEIDHINDY
jgi:galactose-1-phosphate uridylyltransferase